MEWIRQFYFPEHVLKFLKKPILGINPLVDYWIIMHFISGVILNHLLGPGKQALVISLLVGYEIFEVYLFGKGLAIRESFMNQVLDVAVGYGGYIL